MKSDKIIQSLLGILILILSGLFAWTLNGVGNLNREVLIMKADRVKENGELEAARGELKTQIALVQQTLDGLEEDNDTDASQTSQLRKHWTIVSRHRDWINELRAADGLPLRSWPDMSGF